MHARRICKASQFNDEYHCLNSEGMQNTKKNVSFNPPITTTTWGGEAVTSFTSRANEDVDPGSDFPISSSSSVVCSVSDGTIDLGSLRDIADIEFDTSKYKTIPPSKGPTTTDTRDNENIFDDKVKDLNSNHKQTPDMSPASKRKFNIHDFQNTTIEKVLSENSNISKILSGEGSADVITHSDVTGKIGVNGISRMGNGEYEGSRSVESCVDGIEAVSSLSPGRDEYVLNGYHVNGGKHAVGSKMKSENNDGILGPGSESMSNHADVLCNDDVSDPDVNIPDTGCENPSETEVGERGSEVTSDRMTVLKKEQSQLYWKLFKVT